MKGILTSIVALAFLTMTPLSSLAQDNTTVYVTKTGSKYHSAGCSYLSKSSIPKKLTEIGERYSPCPRCSPPALKHGNELAEPADTKDQPTTTKGVKPSEPSKKEERAVGSTPAGKTIYEGPRGGRYHYSKSGKKVYERKKR